MSGQQIGQQINLPVHLYDANIVILISAGGFGGYYLLNDGSTKS